jgi:hypothetical protein
MTRMNLDNIDLVCKYGRVITVRESWGRRRRKRERRRRRETGI